MSSAYTLIYYGNTTVNNSITVPDGEANTIANLSFPGRNFSGYGSPVDQNFLSLVENFASRPEGPANPVVGQFWMDAANSEMCYNGKLDNETNTAESWRSLLYRQIDFDNPANTVTVLAKVGNVVIGNALNTDPNNRTIKFDANGSGNISTGGNLIIGDIGDGSEPPRGNLTISDSGGIAMMGVLTVGEYYDAAGNRHSNLTISPSGNISTTQAAGANVISTIVGDSTVTYASYDSSGNPIGYPTGGNYTATYSNGNLTATGNVLMAQNGNSSLIVGNPASLATNGTVLEAYGNVVYHGNVVIQGTTFTVNSTITTFKDAILDLGAQENNAPLVSNDGADRGLALHTIGTGKSFTTTAAVAIGGTVIPLNSVTGITVGDRIGCPSVDVFDRDAKVTAIGASSVTISPATSGAILPSSATVAIGLDNIHFIGWDERATSGSSVGEFAFTNQTVEVSVFSNDLGTGGAGDQVTTGGGGYADIHAAKGTFEGNVVTTAHLMPTANGVSNIGDATFQWNKVNAANIGLATTTLYGNGFNITSIDVNKSNIYAYLGATTLPALTAQSLTTTGGVTAAGTVSGSLLTGTITTAAQPNITSLGTLSGLIVNGSAANLQSGLITNRITGGAATNTIAGKWVLDTGATFEATYADLAERHHADSQYPTGSVMTVGGTEEITGAQNGDSVLGVVSEAWAYLMNESAGSQETHPAVAYCGRVPVRIVGPIKKHDRVSPFKDGVAVASLANPFGWAIETNEEPGEKLVMCIIK
jgi:hypothetical protein